MKTFAISALTVLGITLASVGTSSAGDVEAGKAAFNKCMACHAIGEGAKNKVGPELNGLDGRQSGSVEGYAYSDANKNSGITWNETQFKEYIKNPEGQGSGHQDDVRRHQEGKRTRQPLGLRVAVRQGRQDQGEVTHASVRRTPLPASLPAGPPAPQDRARAHPSRRPHATPARSQSAPHHAASRDHRELSGASGPTRASCSAPSSAVAASDVSCAGRCPARTAAMMRTSISPAISRRLANRVAATSTSTGSARMPQASFLCETMCTADGGDGGRKRRGWPRRGISGTAYCRQFILALSPRSVRKSDRPSTGSNDRPSRPRHRHERDRRDLHRRHAARAGYIPRGRQNSAAARRETLHDLLGPPIHHACSKSLAPRSRAARDRSASSNRCAKSANMLAEKLNTHSEGKASGFARQALPWVFWERSDRFGFCSAIPRARWLCGTPHRSASVQPPLKAFHLRSRPTSTSLTWRRLRAFTAAKGIDWVGIRRS